AVVASHQACQFSSSFHHSRRSAPARLYLVYHRGLGYEPIIVVGRIVSVTFVGTALSSRWGAADSRGRQSCSIATARTGEPWPPRIRSGNPKKRNRRPTTASRFARFS